jgi:hypothetical protein
MKNYSQSRICVEKLSSTNQARLDKAKNDGKKPSYLSKLRAAFLKNSIWEPNASLIIGFLNKDYNPEWTSLNLLTKNNKDIDPLEEELRNKNLSPKEVVKIVIQKRIIPIVGLNIEFTNDITKANIRVGFDPSDGSWAYVGKEQLLHKDPNEPTVNLGWLDVGTIIHEFCHVLGMIHEHQNTKGKSIDWDKKAVYEWTKQTQGWDKEITNVNILDHYNLNQLNGSDFDPLSIMLYFFPPELTLNNQGTQQNNRYSAIDVEWINNMYKKNSDMDASEFYLSTYGITMEKSIQESQQLRLYFEKSSNSYYVWIYIIFIILIISLLLFWFYKKIIKKKVI